MKKLEEIVSTIQELKTKQQTVLVAIDGFGGSGKSSLAKSIQEKFPDLVIVEMDDFYLPELKRADFERVLEQVIKPFKEERVANYQIYDWQNDKLIPGKSISPGSIVIIEGVYSMTESLVENYDIKIWIDYSQKLGIERGVLRDGEEFRDKWENKWGPAEREYKETQTPDQKADFIIDGTSL